VWTIAGLLLALFVDRTRRYGVPVHRLGLIAVAAAVAPVVPLPLATVPARETPHFVTAGAWRAVVPAGGAVLVLPTGWQTNLTAMVWQTRADLGFRICGGYALAPIGGARGAVGRLGPARSATTDVFGADDNVWRRAPASATEVAAVRREARRWRIAAAVLPADHPDATAIRAQADRVYGQGRRVDDVWLWRPGGRT
jgi:hypothetical protein